MASPTTSILDRGRPGGAAEACLAGRRSSPSSTTAEVVDVRVSSAEALEATLSGTDARYAQLGTGRCRCRLVACRTASLQLRYESWSLGMLRTGRAPRGAATFLVSLDASPGMRIQGRPAAAGEVFVLFDGDEFDCRSAGPARLVSVSLERAALERRVRDMVGQPLGELRLQGRLHGLRAEPSVLRAICLEAAARSAAPPRPLRDPAYARGLEARLVKALLGGLGAPGPVEEDSRGRALAWRAEAWLRQRLAEPPTISHLCQAMDASERTLHEAFRQHLDTTPKAYLKTLRLNAARHDLIKGETRVTDVALDWGFLHFGWFSQDYRRLFGESPRDTLERGRTDRDRAPVKRGDLLALGA